MPRAKTIPLKMLEDMVKAAGVPVKIIEGDNYDVSSVLIWHWLQAEQ